MGESDFFFRAIGIDPDDRRSITSFARNVGIPVKRLRYYNDGNVLPLGPDLGKIMKSTCLTEVDLKLRMGRVDRSLMASIQSNAAAISGIIDIDNHQSCPAKRPKAVFSTELGDLYMVDCLDLLKTIDDETVDLVFADPPFNLNKIYPSGIDDNMKESQYLDWIEKWLGDCVRILKQGGSLFIWNIPKWSTYISHYLHGYASFKSWITVDIKYGLPLQGRLYPSHYTLLYYIKGEKPCCFHPDRLPMEVCPKCKDDLKDYGGYKDKMNPLGVNLTDVWYDIPPVRHPKYKRRNGANELSIKLLDRVIEMASDENDLVFDPFGGSGTTYIVAEIKGRRWLGSEIGPVDDIIKRFDLIDEERNIIDSYRSGYNQLFTRETLNVRRQKGLWTPDSVRASKKK